MKTRKLFPTILAAAVMATGLLAGCGSTPAPEGEAAKSAEPAKEQVVNLYTARNYEVDEVLYKNFTEQTGIKVNVVKGKAEELIERLKREGESTSADLFATVDGGVLNNAKEAGVLQTVQSKAVEENVPATLRDKDNQWIGLSTRARVIAYAKDRVKPEQLSTYEDLATDKWKGKVLVRSSTSLYNQSLVASLVELNGAEKTEVWATGLVANLARTPEGGDRDQVKAMAAGTGDVAIMNTYYLGLMLNSKDPAEVEAAKKVALFFPNQNTTGAHINVSGIALAKHSKNTDNAVKFVEFLTNKESQELISKSNYEYPVNAKAEKADVLKTWGDFKAQTIDFSKLGVHNKQSLTIMNKVGWK